MALEVGYTDEFETWWSTLNEDEQELVAAFVGLLEERGPQLPHPYSSDVKTSHHGQNNYECNITGDRIGCCMLLIHGVSEFFCWGGDKTGDTRWYEKNVPQAGATYRHLAELKKERLIDDEKIH